MQILRCRIEPIYGVMTSRCRDEVLRTIGMEHTSFLYRVAEFGVQYGAFCEFALSEGSACMLKVRAGSDFGRWRGKSSGWGTEKLPKKGRCEENFPKKWAKIFNKASQGSYNWHL